MGKSATYCRYVIVGHSEFRAVWGPRNHAFAGRLMRARIDARGKPCCSTGDKWWFKSIPAGFNERHSVDEVVRYPSCDECPLQSQRDWIIWAAGLLEGEGCFYYAPGSACPYIALGMADFDIVERFQQKFAPQNRIRTVCKPNRKPIFRLLIAGTRAIGLMFTVFPFLGLRRQAAIIKTIHSWKNKAPKPRKTNPYCKQGHRYTPENTKVLRDKRVCRICRRKWGANARAKRKAKGAYSRLFDLPVLRE